MKNNLSRKAAMMLAASVFTLTMFGQTRSEVIDLYNSGVKSIQTNLDSAIFKFENVVKLSEAVGETANDMKDKAIQVLPGLYLKSASTKYSEKKPAAEVVSTAKKAIAVSDKYGNTQVKENANKLLLQGYNRMATEFFSKKDYNNALLTFDSVLAINPEYLPAMMNKALIYRTQNNAAAYEETMDNYLSKAGDADKTKASAQALEYFRAAGSKANQAGNLDEALNLFNKAAKYGEDKDLYYYFADVYNKQKKFDQGAEYAQKGLGLESGAADAKAKFYFQLALAQEGKGQTAEACESFKNAMFGAFAEPSKAKRTNLKCQ